jgi:mersacidin/lichenicidin family type 2 lantibiotic
MSRTVDVVRAWKDPAYRKSLTAEERAALPPNPAGLVELGKEDLGLVTGGGGDASTPTIVLSNGGSGGTQCTAHSCVGGVFNGTIYINPGTLAGVKK